MVTETYPIFDSATSTTDPDPDPDPDPEETFDNVTYQLFGPKRPAPIQPGQTWASSSTTPR
jgi:hypothetical protein